MFMRKLKQTNTNAMLLTVIAEPEQIRKSLTKEIIPDAASVFCALAIPYNIKGKIQSIPITVKSFQKKLADKILKFKKGEEIIAAGKIEIFKGKTEMKLSIHADAFLPPSEKTIKKIQEFIKTLEEEIGNENKN